MLLPTFTTPIRPLVFAVGNLLASLLVMQNGNAQTNTNPVATSSEHVLPTEATLPDITITATRTPTKTNNTIAQTLVINNTVCNAIAVKVCWMCYGLKQALVLNKAAVTAR